MTARPRRACLVAGDLDALAGPRGWARSRAAALARAGWVVHMLHAGPPAASDSPQEFQVRNIYEAPYSDRADRVRHALERMHREHPFDLVEFSAAGGLAFRAVQAKRAGLAFAGVRLAVRLDACGSWLRERRRAWPTDLTHLDLDWAERYAFEHADAQLLPRPDVAEHVRRIGWGVRAEGAAAPAGDRGDEPPLVTACVTHHNLGAFLPEALASLAAQTYPRLEVLVLDDGSTDERSLTVFEAMRSAYPHFRFLRQPNAGAAAARNAGLREGRGEYFVPLDADNVARPDMVERFVAGMRTSPGLGALTCYFLAFRSADDLRRGRYAYAYRPTGGPHTLASLRNVYGDTTAIYHAATFRAVGGYEPDRGSSTEDWEAFVKLVQAGHAVDVLPEHLFYYRHRDDGFSRVTDAYANHARVLRQFARLGRLPAGEGALLWEALVGFQRRLEQLADQRRCLRYRVADAVHALCGRVPGLTRGLKGALLAGRWAWGRWAGSVGGARRRAGC